MKLTSTVFSLLIFPLLLTAQAPARPRPNIVLIMADDMGYSDIGCFGGEIPTPNLDRLAGKGLRFRQFYNMARCCPTRASLLTGLFPHQTGIGHMTEEPANPQAENWGTPGYQGYLNRSCATIAELLKPAGYHTYMAGKWHLGLHGKEKWPLQRGFEKYYGILAGAASYFKPQGGRGLTYNNTPLDPPSGNYYTTDAFTDSAMAFVRSQQDDNPFFLYLAFNAPHWPLQAKPEDIQKFEGKYAAGWDVTRSQRFTHQRASGIVEAGTNLSERDTSVREWSALNAAEKKEVAYRMEVYAAQVSSIDQNVGRLLTTLQQAGKLDNTLIIFLSDNGACPEPYLELGGGTMAEINDPEKSGAISYGMGWANASNTPYRKWKREVEEGGTAAPFIMYWPGGIDKRLNNTIVGTPSYVIDLVPTFLQLAGAQYPAQMNGNKLPALEGRSLLPACSGTMLGTHAYMYWEHEGNQAVRKGNWKAVRDDKSTEWELYDLSTDRIESKNIARQNPQLLRELTAQWQTWANSHFVFPKHANAAK